ncbi:MAG: tRNA (adenosine(37)-N6)-dimethylallyltransferase MiaA [Sphingobacteriales bacterium]|nr:tRNA (adenosine(37)-N6)-dimethylallyltransferase MiaA [Sphingobacteriales bacterium]
MKPLLVVIVGPTAVGKTAMAISLAKLWKTEIVSADSRQFYREMSIGTAKPNPAELSEVKHHFINALSVNNIYTVGDYERDAINLLKDLFARHKIVLMVGGSGLFVKAVCEGLDEFTNIPDELRQQIRHQYETNGLVWLQNQIAQLDPLYYKVVDKQNPRRLLRALEVGLATGQPYSQSLSLQKHIKNKSQRFFDVCYIGLNMPREALYNRINLRVDAMLQDGLLEEAKKLYPEYAQLPALQTVGYTELFDYFANKTDFQTAVELIKQHSRNYAKRQITWFNKVEGLTWFSPEELEKVIAHVQSYLQANKNK